MMCAGKLQSTVKRAIRLTSIHLMFHGDKNMQLILYLEFTGLLCYPPHCWSHCQFTATHH